MRITQIEHGRLLAGLSTGQARLEGDVSELKTDMSAVRTDVSDLKDGMQRLEELVRRGFNLLPEEA